MRHNELNSHKVLMVYLTLCLILFNKILENENMKNTFIKMLHKSYKNIYFIKCYYENYF